MPAPRAAHAVARLVAPILAGLLALITALFTAAPASAHDVITGSDPAEGATLSTAPVRVSVTFDETPNSGFSTLTVVGPDGTQYQQGATTTDDRVASVAVGRLPAAGVYEIGYRIVSSDGHPVTGSVSFTLATPSPAPAADPPVAPSDAQQAPAAQAAGNPAAPPSPAASSRTADSELPAWPFAMLAVGVIAVAVAVVLRRRT